MGRRDKILLSGISGFIGSHLAPFLVERGYDVYGLIRYVAGRRLDTPNIKQVFGDSRDAFVVNSIIKHIMPDIVIHLAALSPVSDSYDHPNEYIDVNLQGTVNLAEACLREVPHFKQFLFASTCYDDKTRAYTTEGLKTYSELKIGDTVFSLNLKTGLIEKDRVTHINIKNYKGKMIHFKTRAVDLLVTPNHKMVIRKTNGDLAFEEADKVKNRSKWKLPKGRWDSENKIKVLQIEDETYDLMDLIYLIGFFIGDGFVSTSNVNRIIKTGLNKEDYLNKSKDKLNGRFIEIEANPKSVIYPSNRIYLCIPETDKSLPKVIDALNRLQISYKRHKTQLYLSFDKRTRPLLSLFNACGKGAHNKQIPPFFLTLSSKMLESLLQGIFDSDGSRNREITTVSQRLTEQLIELGYKTGRNVFLSSGYHKSYLNGRLIEGTANYIYFNKKEYGLIRTKHNDIDYEGIIWCPTIEKNHNLLIERNGRVCFSGNSETFGNGDSPKIESTPQNPNSPYAVSKLAAEKYLLYMKDAYNFPVTILRNFNTYGRKSDYHFVVEHTIVKMLTEKICRMGDLSPIRDLMYVDDHVSAYLTCLDNPLAIGEVFNFCTGTGTKIEEVVQLIKKLVGFEGEIESGTIPRRPLDIDVLVGSYEKAERVLGWKPQYTLEEGLKKTIDFWRNNLK